MRPKLLVLLTVLVSVPLFILGWLGARLVPQWIRMLQDARLLVQPGFRRALLTQLKSIDGEIQAALSARQNGLRRQAGTGTNGIYYLEAPPVPAASPDGWCLVQEHGTPSLLFWQRVGEKRVAVLKLDRTRLLDEIMKGLLASGRSFTRLPTGRITLVDRGGVTLCRWGAYQPAPEEMAEVSLPLSYPLDDWRLDYYATPTVLETIWEKVPLFQLVAGLVAVGIVMTGMAIYLYREFSREMREASQRVSFVNQVSHELKTPLTNIRMYAELMEQQLVEEEGRASRHLGIIVSESQRLSRLIGNILTFARREKDTLRLHASPTTVDAVVAAVLEQFRPIMATRGVIPVFHRGAPARVMVDADALGQILGNLISNVEKYATQGKYLEISTSQTGNMASVLVSDHGPGIPKDQAESIFEPFFRISDRLADGVTGTGIGLTIARELARLHGGDLALEPSTQGACFRVTLKAPPVEEKVA